MQVLRAKAGTRRHTGKSNKERIRWAAPSLSALSGLARGTPSLPPRESKGMSRTGSATHALRLPGTVYGARNGAFVLRSGVGVSDHGHVFVLVYNKCVIVVPHVLV
ncbi:hypothetical protein XENTR_v10011608 [Xenopus tropicalis]|nr:hypothetical protein XENTR_v10011608 [Xenopus tropicalis]